MQKFMCKWIIIKLIQRIKKIFNFQEEVILINDQIININSKFKINASIDEVFNIKKSCKIKFKFCNLRINYKSNLIKNI